MKRKEFLSIWQNRQNALFMQPTASLDPYTGPWTQNQVTHLLRRLTFGAKKEDVVQLLSKTMSQAVDQLLVLDPINTPPVNIYSTTASPDPDVPFGQTFVNAPVNTALNPLYYQARTDVFKAWWTGNLINQKTNIAEKLTFFWHNHFAVEADEVQIAQGMYFYYKLLRENCLGDIRNLTVQMSKNIAMLRYLNGYLNTKTSPDENYGRELQELFTVGKGPDSKYTEDDVKAAAKILTGFRINPFSSPISYFFLFTDHDTSTKQFSTFYGNKKITGRAFNDGEKELDDLVQMLFDNTETARHICRKLYQFFVYYEITSDVEQNIIRPLADIFRQNNFQFKPVLEKLFKSQHFYDSLNLNCVIKSPLDYSIGMIREFDINTKNPDLIKQYQTWGLVTALNAYQGLNIGDPPIVSGWQAWYQSPQFHEIWINADTLANRNRVAENINSTKGVVYLDLSLRIDPTVFAAKLENPESAIDCVKESVSYLYNINLSDTSLNYFKSFLVGGFPDDSYWTTLYLDYKASPNDLTLKNAVTTKLGNMLREIMSQAEYHLS
ncbi:MAG TPA: DUF1800 domain-containing protein [Saprospiraceae bacterium]|jgi:uncharacterized protein (DUF1800 family)|nr:DUF1800 domain-containing protein [Saprospiraceae bacterium]